MSSNKDCRYDVLLIDDIDDYNVVPLDDYVLVRIELPKQESGAGLLLSARENDDIANRRIVGDVLTKGDKVEWVDIGDKVLFNQFSGTVILRKDATKDEPGYEHRLMSEKTFLCKLERKNKESK